MEFDADTYTYLEPNTANSYKGKKLKLFKELKDKEPNNTIFLPMRSETPTVTSVRVKTCLSGALTTFFDTSDEFMASTVKDDNILWQLKQTTTKDGEVPIVRAYADEIWGKLYEAYFDE